MFATAAVVDAKRKDNRRKQWDRAIVEATAGDNSLSSEETTSHPETAVYQPRTSNSDCRRGNGKGLGSVFGSYGHGGALDELLPARLNELDWNLTQPKKDTPMEVQLKALDNHMCELRSAGDIQTSKEEQLPTEAGKIIEPYPSKYLYRPGEPRKRLHLDYMEEMVSKLVTKLLSGTKKFSDGEGCGPSIPSEGPVDHLRLQTKEIWERLASLESRRAQLPTYRGLDNETVQQRQHLNEAIESNFRSEVSNKESIDLMVAKICYNLLVSIAPPNIATYNLMIVHFTRLRQHHHAQAVIDSYFNDSRLRPTSLTISAMLDHYTAAGDKAGFQSMIKRMRAEDGDMHIKSRHVTELVDPRVQAWARKWKVTHRHNILYAKVRRFSIVYESLIRGVLKFFGVRWAAIYLKFAFQDGCNITADLFIQLAVRCLGEENHRAALKLLSAMLPRDRHGTGPVLLQSNAGVRKYIYRLMEFCGINPRKDLASYQNLPCGIGDVQVFRSWLSCLRLESIHKKIETFAETMSGLETVVIRLSSSGNTPRSISAELLQHLNRHPIKPPRRISYSLLTVHDAALVRSASTTKKLQRQIIDVLHESMLDHSRELYEAAVGDSTSMNSSDRLQLLLDLRLNRSHLTSRRLAVAEPSPKTFGIQVYDGPWRAKTWPLYAGGNLSELLQRHEEPRAQGSGWPS